MYIDRKVLYIILGLFILSNVVGLLTDTNALLSLLLTLPAVLVAITFHEFAHGIAADKLGDDTPRRQGRLNLNPLSHLDPIGTIMLVFAGFGWGKPVEIDNCCCCRTYYELYFSNCFWSNLCYIVEVCF